MNQDLAFEITPAKARKLLKASQICRMEIPDIENLARTDLLNIEGSLEEKELIQFVADTGYRCVVCPIGFDITRARFVELLKQTGIKNIIVTGGNAKLWQGIDVNFEQISTMVTHSFQNNKRKSVVIYDWARDFNEHNLRVIATEFPKSIAFVKQVSASKSFKNLLTDYDKTLFVQDIWAERTQEKSVDPSDCEWWDAACSLYPMMPREIFFLSKHYFKTIITQNWLKQDINDLAFLYNVFIPEKMLNYGFRRECVNEDLQISS